MGKEIEYLIEKIFLRNGGFLFDGRGRGLDDFRGAIFPLKPTDINPYDPKRTLTPQPLTTTPILENVPSIPQYNSIIQTINTKIMNFFNKYSNRRRDPRKRTQNNASEQPLQLLTLFILLAQERAGNISESLLIEIWQIVYSSYRAKQISKQVFNNLIKIVRV